MINTLRNREYNLSTLAEVKPKTLPSSFLPSFLIWPSKVLLHDLFCHGGWYCHKMKRFTSPCKQWIGQPLLYWRMTKLYTPSTHLYKPCTQLSLVILPYFAQRIYWKHCREEEEDKRDEALIYSLPDSELSDQGMVCLQAHQILKRPKTESKHTEVPFKIHLCNGAELCECVCVCPMW